MTPPRLELGFADVLDLLTEVFEVPPTGRKALTSRLKHLQAKRFPAGVNQNKARVRYDATAVMGIVVVMALVASFVPPDVAVAVTRENWEELRRLIGKAAQAAPSLDGRPDPGMETHALIEANALSDLGSADAAEGRAAGVRGTRKLRTLRRKDLSIIGPAGLGPAATLLDVAALVERTAGKLISEHGQEAATILTDLRALGPVADAPAGSASDPASAPEG